MNTKRVLPVTAQTQAILGTPAPKRSRYLSKPSQSLFRVAIVTATKATYILQQYSSTFILFGTVTPRQLAFIAKCSFEM